MSKRYIIVGGSSGIGQKTIERLLEAGDSVINFSRNKPSLDSPNLTHYDHDILSNEGLPDIDGAIDGIVYNPGSINLKPFRSLKPSDFIKDFEINLIGAVKTIQKYTPHLKKSENGSIVLFSTVAVGTGMSFHSTVAASKGAVEGLTRSLAAEFSPDIRVNCIAPSIVDTPLASRFLSTPEKIEASAKRHPLNKVGSVEDIAAAVTYLLSHESGWMTGQILSIDGGLSSIRSL